MRNRILLIIATVLTIIGCMSITSYAAQEKFFSTTFEEFGIGYNCNEPNLIDDTGGSVTAKVAADPTDANNQCMMLYAHRPNPVIPTNMVHPYMHFGNNDYTSIVLRYKAYIDPNSAETWQFALRSESGNISVATLSDSSFSALGQTRAVSPGWHEYEWRVTDATIDILIDGVPVTPTPRNANYATVKSLRLGVVGHENDPRPLYIDDLVYFEISDKPDIRINKDKGLVEYGETLKFISSEDATIYYTVDGSTPTYESNVYNPAKGITICENGVIISAFGISYNGKISGIYNFGKYFLPEEAEIIVINNPIKSGGTAKYGQRLFIAPSKQNCKIYYSLDGTEPDCNSIFYTGTGIDLCQGEKIHIKAVIYQGGIRGKEYDFGVYYAAGDDGIAAAEPYIYDSGSAIFNIANIGNEPKEIFTAIASYDKNDEMLDCKTNIETIYRGIVKYELKSNISDAFKYRSFVWLNDNFKPVNYNEILNSAATFPRRYGSEPIFSSYQNDTEAASAAKKTIYGKSDAEIKLTSFYTENELVLNFDVNDETASPADCIKIYFDIGNEKETYYDSNDFKAVICRNGECDNAEIGVLITENAHGWNCSASIPDYLLSDTSLESGKIIGFDFGYEDYNAAETLLSEKIWRGSLNNFSSTTAFGYLMFK